MTVAHSLPLVSLLSLLSLFSYFFYFIAFLIFLLYNGVGVLFDLRADKAACSPVSLFLHASALYIQYATLAIRALTNPTVFAIVTSSRSLTSSCHVLGHILSCVMAICVNRRVRCPRAPVVRAIVQHICHGTISLYLHQVVPYVNRRCIHGHGPRIIVTILDNGDLSDPYPRPRRVLASTMLASVAV